MLLATMALAPPAGAQDTQPPSVPADIRAVELSETTARVSWRPALDNVGVSGYEVFRDGAALGATATTNFTDAGPLDKYRSYEYAVAAFDAAGNTSAPSATVVFAYRRFPFAMPWEAPLGESVTDLTGWQAGPADQFVTVSNAQLVVGARRIRFLGVNSVFSSCFPPRDVAERVAARLARAGVNCVRFHHMDTQSSPSGIFVSVSSSDPRYRRALDPTQLDRLDYYIAQLKRRGLYVNLNLHVGRNYPGFPTNGAPGYFKGIDNFMPGMIELQKEYARDLLTHVNPYTGLAYTDDPVVAFIEINNENGLIGEWHDGTFGPALHTNYLNELTARWNVWLAARYTNTAALAAAWAPSAGSPYGREFLTNGAFASGLLSPWSLQVSNPAATTSQVLTGAAPNGLNALEVNVTSTSADADAVRLVQGGFGVTQGLPHTVTFWARADAPRTVTAGLAQNVAPWASLGGVAVALSTNWEQHTLVIVPTASASNARFGLGGLASATGRVRLSNVSVKTGNALAGPSSAWPEGSASAEMLVNGSFAAGFASPWTFQVVAPAAATRQLVTNGAPDGGTALLITVQTNDVDAWHVQFFQTGLRLTNGQAYTIRFSAMSEDPRRVSVALMQSGSPWAGRGSSSVNVGTNWQDFTVVITSTADEPSARLNLGELASRTGRVWFANFSMKPGVPGLGLPAGETLGSVRFIRKDDFGLRSRATQRDWMQFLWDTERAYWTGMRDYIKGTLGAKGLVIGTQTSYSPAPLQAELDVVDSHAYWQHPSFPGIPWDSDNWTVGNRPMAGTSSGGTIPGRAHARVAGRPFLCTEYNHPAPITYCTETMPLLAAYAALQDWDGVFGFDFLGSTNLSAQYFNGFFSLGREPSKMVTFPVAAALFRRGDLAPALGESTATVPTDLAQMRVGQTDQSIGAGDWGVDTMLAFQQRLALAAGPVPQVHAAIRNTSLTALASDNGQLTWDIGNGLVLARAPRVKAVIGHANQRGFDLGDGVTVTPGATMQGTNWAALTLLARDGAGFDAPSNRILITAVGYVDNHRMLWKPGMGPTNSPSSVGTNWGRAPTLMEGIPAVISLPVPTNSVTVWALDGRGDRKTRVPVSQVSGKTVFTIGREFETPWYEVAVGYNQPPMVWFTSPASGAALNWPATVTVTGDAADSEGQVTQVELFSGATKLAEFGTAPFSISLSNLALGTYTLQAVAVDNAGARGTSAPVTLALVTGGTLFRTGAVWRYLDTGVDQGAAWRRPDFDDSDWPSGPAQLGFGDGDEATVVNGGPADARHPTIYFRRAFTVPDASAAQALTARLLRDDGAVVYVNGREAARHNMPSSTINFDTLASASAEEPHVWHTLTLDPSLLTNGVNGVAVEVHQSSVTSSDLSFDFELSAQFTAPPPNQPPDALLTSPINGAVLQAGALVTLTALARDHDGSVAKVEFFSGPTRLGEDTVEPYSLTVSNLGPGTHNLRVVATDNAGATGPSPVVTVQVVQLVTTTFIPAGAVWRFLDTGSDPGTAWRSNSFNDSSWRSGPAELGFGDGDEATLVASNRQITTCFRRAFQVSDSSPVQSLIARLLRDDGAVVYLNGAEVWRNNMPAGAVTYLTPASSAISGAAETNWLTTNLPPANLITGANLLAVEIHQNTNTSSDISFNFELTGLVRVVAPPELHIAPAAGVVTLTWADPAGWFQLHTTTNLAPPITWSRVTNTPALLNGQWTVTLSGPAGPQRFFRLQSP